MKEIWRDIDNWEGLYRISNFGNVYSIRTQQKLTPAKRLNYLVFHLYLKRKISNLSAHRLVALAFIPNPNNYPEVNHIDGNKANNRVDNLEWCSKSENRKHAFKLGLINQKGEFNNSAKLTNIDILEIRRLHLIGYSYIKLAEQFKVHKNHIGAICRNECWKNI